MPKVKKVVITAFGDESKLSVVDAELAEPSAGEVQVAVEYSVVAGSDVNMRRGTYPFQKKAPLTPGYSVLGVVRQNGKDSLRFKLGDRVACLSKYEGQSEMVNLPERFLVPVPDGLDGEAAVALVLDWVTAYEMLHHSAKVKEGQKIFVHGLSGAVGFALLQLGRLAGLQVYGTASASKHQQLRDHGAFPFDYKDKRWIAAMQQMGGVDAVFDPLGFESFDESYRVLRRGGILVGYGMNLPSLTNTPRRAVLPVVLKLFARNLLFWTGKRATFFGLNRASQNYRPDLERLFAWLKEGKISVPIKATFSMDQIREAHREYEHSAGIGSIVLRINGSDRLSR